MKCPLVLPSLLPAGLRTDRVVGLGQIGHEGIAVSASYVRKDRSGEGLLPVSETKTTTCSPAPQRYWIDRTRGHYSKNYADSAFFAMVKLSVVMWLSY